MNNSISTVCFLYGHWHVSWGPHGAEHSLAPGRHRGRHRDNYASWHLQLPFSTSALFFTDEKSLPGTSPGPGRTCTKLDAYTGRGKNFLLTDSGAFLCDLLLSKRAGKSLLRGKYQTDGQTWVVKCPTQLKKNKGLKSHAEFEAPVVLDSRRWNVM